MKRPLADEIWYGNSASARLARGLLTPLSWLYAAGWTAYRAMYRIGAKKPKQPHRPIVCVGNLVVGGSGKTPLTLHVADVLREMGRDVVVSCSGYGGPASAGAQIAPEGELSAPEWGDEPAMMRRLRPDLKLIVGRDRVEAARLCGERYPDAVLLLDDGFQHLPLHKDVSILIEPESKNRLCLPAGPYREPHGRLSEADVVIPDDFQVQRRPLRFVKPGGEPAAMPAAQPVSVLCAIGDPERFANDLKAAGLRVEMVKALRDHDKLDAGNLLHGLSPDRPVVVTAKDWVKLLHRSDVDSLPFVVAIQDVELTPAHEFRTRLASLLHEAVKKEN
jgi:tetraacyldisaccharide 4'-kinase